MNARRKLLAGALAAALAAGLYWALRETGALATIMDADALHAQIVRIGAWGPALVVALMMLAIVASPLPSAPIALAAGAAYGDGWGTLYVLLGAELGALAAFAIARVAGRDTVHRWFGDRLSVGLIGSQDTLMGIVFVSRLLPFVSFDVVSYAAGLTLISAWRFALATLAGIAPTSFLLAHFGSEMGSGEPGRIGWSVLALGSLTLVPLVAAWLRDRRARRRDTTGGPDRPA